MMSQLTIALLVAMLTGGWSAVAAESPAPAKEKTPAVRKEEIEKQRSTKQSNSDQAAITAPPSSLATYYQRRAERIKALARKPPARK